MAHFQQRKFVAEVRSRFPEFFERAKVLEVGSWTYNDTIRTLFHSCDYVGSDVAGGPDVDLVVPGQDLGFPTGHFDVVISCECFEHNPFWLETFLNMARMLRPGGLFVLTCASTGRGEHGTSRTSPGASLTAVAQHTDYYQNLSKRDFERRVTLENHFSHHLFMTNLYSKDLYFVGFKRGAAAEPTRLTPGHSLIVMLLRDKERHAVERIFRLLGLAFRHEDLRSIHRGLANANPKVRAGSRELLENLLAPPLRESVIGLVDDVADERRLAALRPDLARASIEYEALLTVLGDGRRLTLRSLAAYHARELGLTMHVRPEVESKETGVFASRVLEAAQALDTWT